MEEAYRRANDDAIASGRSRGHFMVDLCRCAQAAGVEGRMRVLALQLMEDLCSCVRRLLGWGVGDRRRFWQEVACTGVKSIMACNGWSL